jgi:hypothetical protein
MPAFNREDAKDAKQRTPERPTRLARARRQRAARAGWRSLYVASFASSRSNCGYGPTFQVIPECRSFLRSPLPRFSVTAAICSWTSWSYGVLSTARRMPSGIGISG